jgi:lysosomal Pro-X carboxypeptidase
LIDVQETYFTRDGVNDMFYARSYNSSFVRDHCYKKYGVTPRPDWIRVSYGGFPGTQGSFDSVMKE